MNRIAQAVAWIVCAGLLLGILVVLISIGRNGIRIELAGEVNVVGMQDHIALSMSEPIPLVMEEPAQLITTGPDGNPISTALSLVPCPECGAPMLPVRWSPWTGEIEWSCSACGARATRAADSD